MKPNATTDAAPGDGGDKAWRSNGLDGSGRPMDGGENRATVPPTVPQSPDVGAVRAVLGLLEQAERAANPAPLVAGARAILATLAPAPGTTGHGAVDLASRVLDEATRAALPRPMVAAARALLVPLVPVDLEVRAAGSAG